MLLATDPICPNISISVVSIKYASFKMENHEQALMSPKVTVPNQKMIGLPTRGLPLSSEPCKH